MSRMSSWTLLARRLLFALLCLCSVTSAVQPQVHDLLVEHVFCAEHQAREHVAAEADTHGDGCWNPGWLGSQDPVADRVVRTADHVDLPEVAPLTGGAAPRAPPLSFAPKTSPPALI